MADNNTKLLPCPNPWCDCPDGLFVQPLDRKTLFGVQCACGFEGPVMDSEQRAIAAWNTRAAPPAMDREAEGGWKAELRDFASLMVDEVIARTKVQLEAGNGLSVADQLLMLGQLIVERKRNALSTLSADAIRQGEGIEGVVRVAVWNAAKKKGVSDEAAMATVAAVVAELPATPASHASDGEEA